MGQVRRRDGSRVRRPRRWFEPAANRVTGTFSFLWLIRHRAGARDFEGKGLTRRGVGSDLHNRVRLPRVLHRLERRTWPGSELHGLGQHHYKVLRTVQSLGIEAGFAAIRHVIADLELSFSGTQGEHESVEILLFLWHRSRVDGLAAGGHRHALVNLGAIGEIEFEALIAHLGARRVRSIIDREKTDALQLTALRLEPHHVGGYADALDFFRDVVNLHLNRSRSRRSHAVIGHTLVNDADQVGTVGIVEFDAKVALGVSLSAAGLFHPLAQTKEHDVVACCGLFGGAIGDFPG